MATFSPTLNATNLTGDIAAARMQANVVAAIAAQAGDIDLVDLQASSPSEISLTNAPTGTTSTTGVMMGLGGLFAYTPTKSGKCKITLRGSLSNNTGGDGVRIISLRYGTGTAPANADAITGTVITSGNTTNASLVVANTLDAGEQAPFEITVLDLDLSAQLTVALWFDVVLAAITGGTASIVASSCNIVEDSN